ncbi:hypothetical protein GN244_ATG20689 [Phytophthora infestans]|uniref:Uncharacterized protein n=1 Tax=Phytophthora infestans TaxID=4787 RepID=A0A833S5P0_PHYIN|nr:hypothetical protein GN244_ATG20689 [Phytophthora infestans]
MGIWSQETGHQIFNRVIIFSIYGLILAFLLIASFSNTVKLEPRGVAGRHLKACNDILNLKRVPIQCAYNTFGSPPNEGQHKTTFTQVLQAYTLALCVTLTRCAAVLFTSVSQLEVH